MGKPQEAEKPKRQGHGGKNTGQGQAMFKAK
jgi:hypothetical protein